MFVVNGVANTALQGLQERGTLISDRAVQRLPQADLLSGEMEYGNSDRGTHAGKEYFSHGELWASSPRRLWFSAGSSVVQNG